MQSSISLTPPPPWPIPPNTCGSLLSVIASSGVESEGQPPGYILITRAFVASSYSAPRLSLDKQAAVLKHLTTELALPFPKGRVPLLDILFFICVIKRMDKSMADTEEN